MSAVLLDAQSRTSVAGGRWALVLMAASGFAGLGYQIVWTQQSALWLGHESASILAVVAAFFGGVAVGAFALGSLIDRSERPSGWYAACEAVIALWSLTLAALMAPLAHLLLDAIGEQPSAWRHWSIAFFGTFVMLLPATAAMGATLPAMERMLSDRYRYGESIAPLYAANTLGAVLGVLGTALFLAPTFGFTVTALVCAMLNGMCAIAAVALFPRPKPAPPRRLAVRTKAHLPILAATGLLGIGYEVLVVRVLSQIAENTVYTFALLLAVYLVGTTLGAAWYGKSRNVASNRTRDRLLQLQSLTCFLGVVALSGAALIRDAVLNALGIGMLSALIAEAAIAIAAFLLPTIVMGALFGHLMTAARAAGIGFGLALGVNTIGAALAPLLFGVLVSPWLGSTMALMVVAIGYLALASLLSWRERMQWIVASVAIVIAFWSPSLAFIDIPPGGRLVHHQEGASAIVSIVEDAHGVRTLHINNRQQEGSSATLVADSRQALLPILLHSSPRRALFLGLGTGMTARSATADPQVQVDVIELLPEVIEASKQFADAFDADSDDRLRIVAADSRRFVRTSKDAYDVVVADNFHPARSGSGVLYTSEHFAAVRARLKSDGLFCQWLPLHQLDLDTLRSIVRSFLDAYPHAFAILATNSLDTPVLGLIAKNDSARFDARLIRERFDTAQLSRVPAEVGLVDELAVLGSFVAGPESLAKFASSAPLNTDDHPVVMYRAPRITYAPDSAPRDRLTALLDDLEIEANEVLEANTDVALMARLTRYWSARDQYLAAGRTVEPTMDVRKMLSQVREPLLGALRTSPEFRPAYDPLLQMAIALHRIDAREARALLRDLDEVQPYRPEAKEMLKRLAHH